jgi:hypothetical protein
MSELRPKPKRLLNIYVVSGLLIGIALFLLGSWFLLFGPVFAMTAFHRAVQNPVAKVFQLQMVSSYYNRINDNHNYWFTFHSDKAVSLKDADSFESVSTKFALERTAIGRAQVGCRELIGDDENTSILLSSKSAAQETYTDWDTGRIFVHNKSSNTYCFQSWYYYD